MKLRATLDNERLASGFTSENDIFHQEDLAKRLTSLVTSLSHGSVSILDGRWGTGKSTFVRMWIAHLEKIGVPAIYFDAFNFDYIQDPFQAVSSAFIKFAVDKKKTSLPAYQRYLNTTAKVAKRLAGVTAKAGAKLVTLGAVGAAEIDALEKLSDDLSDSAGEISEDAVKALLERHASDSQMFEALRKELQELPSLFSLKENELESPKLVVVIDELDRCRPDFALGILETLKHFFRTDNIHFVLVTNMNHLCLSVNHRYGILSESYEYIQKFFDFVIHFDQNYETHQVGNVGNFVSSLFRDLMPSSASQEDSQYIPDFVARFSRAHRLSLRQIESVVTNVVLALLAANPREFRPALILVALCVLKTVKPEIYKTAKAGKFDYSSFSKFMSDGSWDGNFDLDRMLKLFRFYSDESVSDSDPEFRDYGRSLWDYNLDRFGVIPYLANSIVDRFGRV